MKNPLCVDYSHKIKVLQWNNLFWKSLKVHGSCIILYSPLYSYPWGPLPIVWIYWLKYQNTQGHILSHSWVIKALLVQELAVLESACNSVHRIADYSMNYRKTVHVDWQILSMGTEPQRWRNEACSLFGNHLYKIPIVARSKVPVFWGMWSIWLIVLLYRTSP